MPKHEKAQGATKSPKGGAAAAASGSASKQQQTQQLRLDPAQARLASDALLQHVSNQKASGKAQLFDDDDIGNRESVLLVVALRKVPQHIRVKPKRLALPNDLYDEHSEVCLIVKDPQATYKELLATANKDCAEDTSAASNIDERRIPVTKIIGLQKLRDNYKTFEAKRQLSAGFDLFLADDRIIPLLPKILGKSFFQKKKQPVPVEISKANHWAHNVRVAIFGSTYMHQNPGNCTVVRAGHTGMTGAQLAENIVATAAGVANGVPKKWGNIHSLHVKTADSISLPIFNNAIVSDAPSDDEGAAADEADTADAASDAGKPKKNMGTKKRRAEAKSSSRPEKRSRA